MALRVVEGAGHLLLVVAVPTLMAALAAERDRAMVMGALGDLLRRGFHAGGARDRRGRARGRLCACMGGSRRGGLILWIMLPRGVDGRAPGAAAPFRPPDDLLHAAPLRAGPRATGSTRFLFLALVTYLPARAWRAMAGAGSAGRGAHGLAPDRAARLTGNGRHAGAQVHRGARRARAQPQEYRPRHPPRPAWW
jgi:hypothetical protein